MEVVGAMASIGSIIDLSAKVVSSCHKYITAVKSAEQDIVHLRNETESLQETLQAIRNGGSQRNETLLSSPSMVQSLDDCFGQLSRLKDKLQPRKSTGLRHKLLLRQLEWPFEAREIDDIIKNIQAHKQSISLCLQADQV